MADGSQSRRLVTDGTGFIGGRAWHADLSGPFILGPSESVTVNEVLDAARAVPGTAWHCHCVA